MVNSKDPSLNTADAYSYFLQNLCLKRTKISKTEAGGWVIFEKTVLISALLIKLMKCANNHPLSCVAFQLMYKKIFFATVLIANIAENSPHLNEPSKAHSN